MRWLGGKHDQSPVVPSQTIGQSGSQANRHLWGLYDVTISSDRKSVEVTPIRSAEMHLNATKLLEVQPCKTCLKFNNIKVWPPDELTVDVTLTHPFPGALQYTAFDVRGIFIAGSDFTFPSSGRKIAWTASTPMMLFADGYTQLFNPTEFPYSSSKPPIFKYYPGKFATGGDLSATLNAFTAFDTEPPRCMFGAGTSSTREFRIKAGLPARSISDMQSTRAGNR